MFNINSILYDVDDYKVSMHLQYPPGTEYVSSYVEARVPDVEITHFGSSHILHVLQEVITEEAVFAADAYWTSKGQFFPLEGWLRIARHHKGKLPLRIQALPEGLRISSRTAQVQVVNTDPLLPWLTTWSETKLLRVWYPSTTATQSREFKDIIYHALVETADDPDAEILYKLHDFGSRGVSSVETASIGGAGHLLNFRGSDTSVATLHVMNYYNAGNLTAGEIASGIPAAEHSTVTSWGRDKEKEAYENLIKKFGRGLVSIVADSYDFWNATDKIFGCDLKDQIVAMTGMLIIRPDSGDPTTVPVNAMRILEKRFGVTINTKGFKVLNNVRIIQGDGLHRETLIRLINNTIAAGYSITNLAFGMGGGLLQMVNRDTYGYAMKASANFIDNAWRDVYKDPITDPGKTSKRGRLAVIHHADNGYQTIREEDLIDPRCNLLQTVFENGHITNSDQLNWTDVLERASK